MTGRLGDPWMFERVSQHEIDAICDETTLAMQEFVKPFTTPIIRLREGLTDHDAPVDLVGTGALFRATDGDYVLTASHVARLANQTTLCHQLGNSGIYTFNRQFAAVPHPSIDFACVKIDYLPENRWRAAGPFITSNMLSPFLGRTDAELFFFQGFPADRSQFRFETLLFAAHSYLTNERNPRPTPEFDSQFLLDFALEYGKTPATPGEHQPAFRAEITGAGGLSGALVWNTGRVRSEMRGQTWSPQHARVCGMVVRWLTSDSLLVCTKMEAILQTATGRRIAP